MNRSLFATAFAALGLALAAAQAQAAAPRAKTPIGPLAGSSALERTSRHVQAVVQGQQPF